MKRDQIEEGRVTEHSRGLGTVTRETVLKRAREIALINGRSEQEVLPNDFDQAKRELTGGGELVADPEAPARRSHDEIRETIRGSQARVAGRVSAHDEQTDTEKIVEQGMMDAEHDRMVEGTRESLRRDSE